MALPMVAAAGWFLAGGGIAASSGPAPEAGKAAAAVRQDFSSKGVLLTVEEPAGLARRADPVTSGVPLPEGSATDPGRLALLDEGGRPVPCQFAPQSRWPDGSVKWALLDFQSDLPARGRSVYKLALGGPGPAPAAPAEPVRVSRSGAAVAVSTGNFSFEVSKDAACLVRSVRLAGGQAVTADRPIQVEMAGPDGRIYRSAKPREIVVEQQGPMRATVLVRGELVDDRGAKIFDGKVGYDLRLTAYAGKPWLAMAFTLRNDGFYGYRNERKPRQWLRFRSLALEVPLSAPAGAAGCRATLGGESRGVTADSPVSLVQWYKYPRRDARGILDRVRDLDPHWSMATQLESEASGWYCRLEGGDRPPKVGGKAEGLLLGEWGGRLQVCGAVRRFHQNFPRGLAASSGGLAFLLWPDGGYWPRSEEAFFSSTYQFEGGRRKTAEVLLAFEAAPGDAGGAARLAFLDHPLHARAPEEWYADSGAVWPLAPSASGARGDAELREARERYDRLQLAKVAAEAGDPAGQESPVFPDRWGKVSIPDLWERSPEVFCGWMNYGDLVWGHGYCSLYYEWPYAMLQQYLRLGDARFLDVAGDMARHRYDIDQYHVTKTGPWLGGFQRYEKGEHGNLDRQGADWCQWEKNTAPSHTWNRGLLLYWALTGDPRALETARENGEAFRAFLYGQHKLGSKTELPWSEFRVPAWAIENWLALYEYTGEKQYLDWSREAFAKTLLAMERANGSQGHIVKGGRQSAQFTAYTIEPVCRLHRLTGDRAPLEFLKRVLDWQRRAGTLRGKSEAGRYLPIAWLESWEAPPDPDGPLTIGAGNSYSFLFADGYAYLYRQLGRREDLDFARQLFKESVFYYGLGNGAAPGERTPLGYHYLGSPFDMTPKMHAWSGRYCQLYLSVESGLERPGARE